MAKGYPMRFTLDDGVDVVVNPAGPNSYHFTLKGTGGAERTFTLVDDDRPKEQIDASLDFDQLNAVRKFWLERDNLV